MSIERMMALISDIVEGSAAEEVMRRARAYRAKLKEVEELRDASARAAEEPSRTRWSSWVPQQPQSAQLPNH